MNQFGRRLRIQILGESHGEGVGLLLDGLPPGLPVSADDVQAALDRRRPGTGPLVSQRQETDQAAYLSGVHKDRATGAPLLVWIGNEDTRSKDYAHLLRTPRPGHSDWVAGVWARGHQDHRGGGHYSGRLTAGLVAGGALVTPLLRAAGIRVGAHLHAVGGESGPVDAHDVSTMKGRVARSAAHTAHEALEERFVQIIDDARKAKDSVGGIVAWRAEGVPVALGDPFFDPVESLLSHLFFAVPAVKGVDFGAGFAATAMKGSEHNDPYTWKDGAVEMVSNHAGGILGGRTTGAPLWGHVAIKPTSSIFQPQGTVDLEAGDDATLELKGRHDPCIAIRAVPVIEACVKLVLADLVLQGMQEGHVEVDPW